MTTRQILGVFLAGCLSVAAAIAVIFQDNITRFNLNPRTPFQTYTPPPAPEYGARGAWVVWPSDLELGDTDIFYVHSTTYSARRYWNSPITTNRADATLRRVAAPNEVGPFMQLGAVYGPRYRQATLFASFTHKFDGRAAHELAYQDVERAFLHYLGQRDPERNLVIVGYGQGGLHVLGLLQYHVAQDSALLGKLAVAYVIGASTPVSIFNASLSPLTPCESPEEIACVISYIDLEPGFDDERRRATRRALIWNDNKQLVSIEPEAILCVNPLVWTRTDELIPPDRHLGSASATGLGLTETPAAIANAVSAQCNNGTLQVSSPQQTFLQRHHWFGDHWRPQDFNLFYHDLTADAARRIDVLRGVSGEIKPETPVSETELDLGAGDDNNG